MARVRLIDDDEEQVEVRRLILERAGHCVVESGFEAVVMDLHMPFLDDGLRMIRELAGSGARICVLSGFVEDLRGTLEEGMVHKVLAKPVRTEVLLRWLSEGDPTRHT